MDTASFRPGDWLLVTGGAVMLVLAQLLDWATVETARGSGGLNNAFDYPPTGGLAWGLTVASGLATFLFAGGLARPGRAPWPAIVLAATGAATALMIVRVVLGGGEIVRPGITYELQRGPGMWAGLVGAGLGLAGAVLNHRAVGDRPDPAESPRPNGILSETEDAPPSAPLPPSG